MGKEMHLEEHREDHVTLRVSGVGWGEESNSLSQSDAFQLQLSGDFVALSTNLCPHEFYFLLTIKFPLSLS